MTEKNHYRVPAMLLGILSIGMFPLLLAAEDVKQADFVGAETCLSCHSDESSFKDSNHAKAWLHAKNINFGKSCETCHGPGSLHAEAAGDKSNPGFATIKGPKTNPMGVAESCLACHKSGKPALWKGSTHESRGLSCVDCHSMHKGNPKNLATSVEKDTCQRCHSDKKMGFKKNSHHPIVEGKMSCTSCHNPHGTVTAKLIDAPSINQKCYECHAEKRGPYLWEHRPVTEDCTSCHKPHGSKYSKLLVMKLPYLCQSCHSNARHPSTMYAINPATTGTDTYQRLSSRASYRGCVNCHATIHGSNHAAGKRFLR